jgi:hypothetical protein
VGWLKLLPNARNLIEGGSLLSIGRLKLRPKVRCVRERGRLSTCWLNMIPKVRCWRDGGSRDTSWLNCCDKERRVREEGRWAMG